MNCKEAGVELCWSCGNGEECWIPQNENFFKEVLKFKTDLKSQLVDDIKNNNISHVHVATALKLYYPEYYDWFQKMLLLK